MNQGHIDRGDKEKESKSLPNSIFHLDYVISSLLLICIILSSKHHNLWQKIWLNYLETYFLPRMLSPKYSVKDFTKFTSKMVDGSIFDRRRFNNPLVNLRGIRNNTLIIYYSSSVLKIIEFV